MGSEMCIRDRISIAVLIEINKDTSLQDWLERCVWGRLSSQRYKTADEANAELKIALDAA